MTTELIEKVARAIADVKDWDGDLLGNYHSTAEINAAAQAAIAAIRDAGFVVVPRAIEVSDPIWLAIATSEGALEAWDKVIAVTTQQPETD